MRDSERIPDVIRTVVKIWEKNPDLRLMQLLMNACDYSTVHMYGIEDHELVNNLKELYYQQTSCEIDDEIDDLDKDTEIPWCGWMD